MTDHIERLIQQLDDYTFVAPTWIDRADLHPER